ncbi:MAG TPA: hypothetical protein VIK61_09650 [Acidimicrobiia bacterium]
MAYVLGTRTAELLIRVGLPRREVVRALIEEIGMTETEADAAWLAVENNTRS